MTCQIKEFDCIITLCDHAAQNCPVFPGKGVRLHQGFSDPAAVAGNDHEVLEAFRKVRDELKQFILSVRNRVKNYLMNMERLENWGLPHRHCEPGLWLMVYLNWQRFAEWFTYQCLV